MNVLFITNCLLQVTSNVLDKLFTKNVFFMKTIMDNELLRKRINYDPTKTNPHYSILSAIHYDDILYLKLVNRKHKIDDEYYTLLAAMKNKIEILRYLIEINCAWNHYGVMNGAVYTGSIDMIKFLREKGCSWNSYTSCVAAKEGHYEVLRYLYENGCPFGTFVGVNAASEGHIDILIYLRKHDFMWHSDLTIAAAKKNRIETFKYLYENGCPVTEECISMILKNGNTIFTNYLKEQGIRLMRVNDIFTDVVVY